MSSLREPDVRMIGKAITVSYVADPVIGRGHFEIENRSASNVTIHVQSASMDLGSEVRELSGLSIFDLGKEKTLDPDGFVVERGRRLDFLLTFPRVPHEPQFDVHCSIVLSVMAGSLPLSAESVIIFERRIPLRH